MKDAVTVLLAVIAEFWMNDEAIDASRPACPVRLPGPPAWSACLVRRALTPADGNAKDGR